jgi:quercetin dioxygenase-like cupin family protein
VRVDFPARSAFPKHTHPGIEIAHVIEGTMEYQLDDQPPVTLNAEQALFIPTGTAHSAKNVGRPWG